MPWIKLNHNLQYVLLKIENSYQFTWFNLYDKLWSFALGAELQFSLLFNFVKYYHIKTLCSGVAGIGLNELADRKI